MINIKYRAARAQGNLTRLLYSKMLPRIVNRPIRQTRRVPVSVYSFSGEHHLPEQIASIRSFIRYVGIPDSFNVVFHGSYSEESRRALQQVNSCVSLIQWDALLCELPQCVRDFAVRHPMGKKLAVLISLPVTGPTIYTDSDILFFPNSEELIDIVESENGRFWYLPDCLPSLDISILYDNSEICNPVNAGFMILKERLNWAVPLKRLAEYKGTPFANTEQTMVHLAMHENEARPLSPKRFILSLDDQFIYRDLHAGKEIALRHYVNNVRHKLWQNINLVNS